MTEYDFDNPNIFQLDGRSEKAQVGEVSFRCPHCMQQGTFQHHGDAIRYKKMRELIYCSELDDDCFELKNATYIDADTNYFALDAAIRICPNSECRGLVFTVSNGRDVIEILPPELVDFDPNDLPEPLLKTLKEAISCHSVGADRAAAMMVRRLLEEICADSGANGKTLHDRLADLKSRVTLSVELFEAMGELKALGNDAAHVEARDYDDIGHDEAVDSIELAKEILKARYQHKKLVERLRSRKKSDGASDVES